jgi:hypothetical protein
METRVMTRSLPKLLLLMLSAMVVLPGHAESELAGYWQHESEPVWIEMQPETGQGVMVRNDNRPDRVDFLVVTDLAASDDPMNGPRRSSPRAWASTVKRTSPYRPTDAWSSP